jgi:hypothetical protein
VKVCGVKKRHCDGGFWPTARDFEVRFNWGSWLAARKSPFISASGPIRGTALLDREKTEAMVPRAVGYTQAL